MIVAGFGFRRTATAASLADALDRARRAAREPAPSAPTALATADDKAGSAAMQDLARRLRLDVEPVAPARLMAQATLTRSAASASARGTGSVAEAAALAAAGPAARLLGPRAISEDRRATCALALRSNP